MAMIFKNPEQEEIKLEDKNGNIVPFTMRKVTKKMLDDHVKTNNGAPSAIDEFVLIFGGNKDQLSDNYDIRVVKRAVTYAMEKFNNPTLNEA